MSIPYLTRLLPGVVGLAGCVADAGVRQHDAMYAAVSRAATERAQAPELDAASLAVHGELDRAALVAAVLARNPDLDAARAAWRAAVAAYPSAVALDDPMASYALAPFSIGADARFGQRVEIAQKLPWPGQRAARGEAALADAEAAQADFESLRLDLAEAAVQAFDDDYVAARALAINQHHRELLARIETSAMAQYSAGRASQQDPLEVRVHVLELDRERLMLDRQQRAATATLNRLLHRKADAPLPPPPARLAVASPGGPRTEHPRQRAASARVRGRRAEVDGANLAFYPGFELMGSYDSMWDVWQHRWMIGVGIEIPIQRGKRRAELERARAEQARAEAELASVTDSIDEGRERARRDADELTRALALYEQLLLPTTRERVDAALAGYATGQTPFSTVVMAEHEQRDVELAIERTRADLDRQLAALDRLDGRIPGQISGGAR
ncbi:MAG TPA: TolC family protein [Kofleriaceae bacterium]|jgi:outer membrane protein TolC|nr:TolC family protein [Kofleriaceae bacterium]